MDVERGTIDAAVTRRRPLTLLEIQSAIRASWGSDTCDEHDQEQWTPEHPSTGQCAATAYVVHDLLGGRLLGACLLYTSPSPRD